MAVPSRRISIPQGTSPCRRLRTFRHKACERDAGPRSPRLLLFFSESLLEQMVNDERFEPERYVAGCKAVYVEHDLVVKLCDLFILRNEFGFRLVMQPATNLFLPEAFGLDPRVFLLVFERSRLNDMALLSDLTVEPCFGRND